LPAISGRSARLSSTSSSSRGALDTVPDTFFAALKDGGRLVALMRRGAVAVASVFVKSGKGIAARDEFNAWLPPLLAVKAEEEVCILKCRLSDPCCVPGTQQD
jgi:hypothetical protein